MRARPGEVSERCALVGMWGVAPHPRVNEQPHRVRMVGEGDLPIPIEPPIDRRLLRHAHTRIGARQLERSTIQKSDNILRPT